MKGKKLNILKYISGHLLESMCKNLAILKELLEKLFLANFVQKSLNLQQEKF
jgi:hypothetical protein